MFALQKILKAASQDQSAIIRFYSPEARLCNMASAHLFLFGDQTVAVAPVIKQLARNAKHSRLLPPLFRAIEEALHVEMATLNVSERGPYFPFRSILDLAVAYEQHDTIDVIMSTVLLCVAQLGSLVE